MSEKKAPPLVDKNCKVCGAVFQVIKYRVKYKHTCSHACRVQASADGHATGVTLITRPCPVCSTSFTVPKGQEQNKQYCSSACGHVARANMLTTAEPAKCEICEVEFLRRKSNVKRTTCSKACGAEKQKRTWASGAGLGTPETAAAAALHRAKKRNAVPAWYDAEAVLEVYKKADEIRRMFDRQVHVDHIVPLTSHLVAGLHWHGNLQILDGWQNLSKGNKSWPDMP